MRIPAYIGLRPEDRTRLERLVADRSASGQGGQALADRASVGAGARPAQGHGRRRGTLFAALNAFDGKVIGQCMKCRRHQEFIPSLVDTDPFHRHLQARHFDRTDTLIFTGQGNQGFRHMTGIRRRSIDFAGRAP